MLDDSRSAERTVPVNGLEVRAARKSKLLSQQALASKAKCSKRTIENLEHGKRIHLGTLRDVAGALEVDPKSLIDDSGEDAGTSGRREEAPAIRRVAADVGKTADATLGIRAPDPLAAKRVNRSAEPYLVMGSAVETLVHSSLSTNSPLAEKGWDLARVRIVDTKKPFDSRPILARLSGGLVPLGPNEANRTKFVLTAFSRPFKDDEENLSLWFGSTDWQTQETVLSASGGLEVNDDLALEFGNLEPELSRVPSGAGLHYIVRFADDTVLLLRRRADIAHEPNKLSISGEEQFETDDFRDGTLLRLFRRTLCEEVIGLGARSPDTLDKRWSEHVEDKIASMKLWGLIFEEHACVTTLFGCFDVRLSRAKFAEWYLALLSEGLGNRDNEGRLYFTTTDELETLLLNGRCATWPLFGKDGQAVTVESSELHRTSRLRAFRLCSAVRGRPLQSSDAVV